MAGSVSVSYLTVTLSTVSAVSLNCILLTRPRPLIASPDQYSLIVQNHNDFNNLSLQLTVSHKIRIIFNKHNPAHYELQQLLAVQCSVVL